MSVINTNIKAEMAISALRMNERPLAVAMQQMSTGKRINSARDDAAGLAIANWMTTEVRSLTQAIRNSTDAISLLQTADGASSEITEMLQRMQKFKCGTSVDHQFISWVATCTNETPETKRRSQPFATGKHQPCNFVDRWNQVCIHLCPAFALYRKQRFQAFVYARSNIQE
jgi:hypothetical protein